MTRGQNALDPTQTGLEAETLLSDLRKRVVGQDEAIDQIVNIYQMFLAGLNTPGRPVGNFLFLGPTGSGKTRMVEATAESLMGDAHAIIKIDCAEFQHSHEIAKLIGSPPGYLGHRETHPLLSQEVLNQYHSDKLKLSFVLFDEIEKASDALWNLLLGVLDKATLTLGDNRRVDFSRTLIFMTSNLGASQMSSILSPNLGFAAGETERKSADGNLDAATTSKLCRAGIDAARRKFTPEFMNRIDKTVVFRPLGEADLRKILSLELGMLQRRIFRSPPARQFVFTVTEPARAYLLREGTDLQYGARHLKRTIDRTVVQPLSNLIASQQVRGGDFVRIDFETHASGFTFYRDAENMPAYAMMQAVEETAGPAVGVPAVMAVEAPRAAARPGRRL